MIGTIFLCSFIFLAFLGAYKDYQKQGRSGDRETKALPVDKTLVRSKHIVEKYAQALAQGTDGLLRKESLLNNTKPEIEEAILYLASVEDPDYFLKPLLNKLEGMFIFLDHFVDDDHAEVVNAISSLQQKGMALSDEQSALLKKAMNEMAASMISRREQYGRIRKEDN